MRGDSGYTASLWEPPGETTFPRLTADAEADVCVIGAGIAGLSCAYLLTREGKSVVVLDDGPIAGGETCRTTAHLSNAIDDTYLAMQRWHGREGAKIAAESHTAAIDQIESIVRDERIDCNFHRVDGFLFASHGAGELSLLEEELTAAQDAGISGVEIVDQIPWRDFQSGPALRFPQQAQFAPLKYLEALVKETRKGGGKIFSHTHVIHVKGGKTTQVRARNGCSVNARSTIVATNSPFINHYMIHSKQAAYRTYVIVARVDEGSIERALYWDTEDPYHYVRVEPADTREEYIIIGGEDHKTGQGIRMNARFSKLEQWARERFPSMGKVEFKWSGQVLETIDGAAFIGPNPMGSPNIYIATGDSGMGMTHGTIAGMLLTDLICKRSNPWLKLYHPSRKTLKAAKEFIHENTNALVQYLDWVTPGNVSSTENIPRESGSIYRHGLSKLAVFKDEGGDFEICSARCPHLGGVVSWNSVERSWDCPIHGSRFDCHGKSINGPAHADLSKVFLSEPRKGKS